MLARLQVPGDGRFNPSARTFCEKCSTRDGLTFAWAYGKPMFLCDRHYKEWFKLANKNEGKNELVRQQPFKQVANIDGNRTVESFHGKQEKSVW